MSVLRANYFSQAQNVVVPAWIAGTPGSMDGAGFGGIPAIWIPAIHAGMTE